MVSSERSLAVFDCDFLRFMVLHRTQTGQWGLACHAPQDPGRIKMPMNKPPAPLETLKYTLSDEGGNTGRLPLERENHIASMPLTVK